MAIRTLAPKPTDSFRILPVIANWREGVRESIEYRTDIITSFDGKEQRRSVRENPRRTFEFTCDLSGAAKRVFDMHMALSMSKIENLLPDPVQHTRLSVPLSIYNPEAPSVQTAFFTGEMPDLQVGQYLIFDLGDGEMEALRISKVAENFRSVELVEQTVTPIPAGTPVYASHKGYVRGEPQVRRRTKSVISLQVAFEVSVGTSIVTPSSSPSYVGWREVFSKKPNWSAPVEVQHVWPRETVDYGFGQIHHFVPISFPSRVTKMNYLGRNKTEVAQVRDFFMRHFGRRREFLMQTWEDDVPYSFIAAGSRSILIPNEAFYRTYAGSSIFRRVVFNMADGTYIHREVDFVEYLEETDTSVLWLKDPLPSISFNANTLRGISWVLVSRFASDKLEILWRTSEVAEFSLATQVLENFDV